MSPALPIIMRLTSLGDTPLSMTSFLTCSSSILGSMPLITTVSPTVKLSEILVANEYVLVSHPLWRWYMSLCVAPVRMRSPCLVGPLIVDMFASLGLNWSIIRDLWIWSLRMTSGMLVLSIIGAILWGTEPSVLGASTSGATAAPVLDPGVAATLSPRPPSLRA